MSRFFTLSFELAKCPPGKADRVISRVKQYLTDQGASDFLMTSEGEDDMDLEDMEEERPRSRSR